jgi:hypothetical protein
LNIKPIHWILGVLLIVGIGAAGMYSNSRFQQIAPGESDKLLAQIALSSDQVLVYKYEPNPQDQQKPKQTKIATLKGEEVRDFLQSVRLNDKELKTLNRDLQYRIRFQRGNHILGGVNLYFHRDWAYMQEPKDELDAPFKGARVFQPTYARKLEAFLTALEK